MKTFLSLSTFIVIASLAATLSAQTTTDPNTGEVRTKEPSDKYGPGGTHESVSDKNYQLIAEGYRDKCGRIREITYGKVSILPHYYFGDKENTSVTYYYDENGKA